MDLNSSVFGRWDFPLTSGVLHWKLSIEQGWAPIWWMTPQPLDEMDSHGPVQTQPKSACASYCNPRGLLPSIQYFSAWNSIPGNCLFLTLSLSLSYFWPFVLGWLQRSCLTLIKFSVLVAVSIRSLAQIEVQSRILTQNGSQGRFLNSIMFHNYKDDLVTLGPWKWSRLYDSTTCSGMTFLNKSEILSLIARAGGFAVRIWEESVPDLSASKWSALM